MTTTNIPGYTYGSAELQKSPVSIDDFAKLKQATLFGDDDVRYLRMSHDVLKDQTEQIYRLSRRRRERRCSRPQGPDKAGHYRHVLHSVTALPSSSPEAVRY